MESDTNQKQSDVGWTIGDPDYNPPLTLSSNSATLNMQSAKPEQTFLLLSERRNHRSSRSSSDETPIINTGNQTIDENNVMNNATISSRNSSLSSGSKRSSHVDNLTGSLNLNRSNSLAAEVSSPMALPSGRRHDLTNSLDLNMSSVLFNSSSGVELKLPR